MNDNQKKPINKNSPLERLIMFWWIIVGLFIANSILFIVLNQFPENNSLIKGIQYHETLKK